MDPERSGTPQEVEDDLLSDVIGEATQVPPWVPQPWQIPKPQPQPGIPLELPR